MPPAVLCDSGTIAEESIIFGFPAIPLRASIERHWALATGRRRLTNLDPDALIGAIQFAIGRPDGPERPADYRITNTSQPVVGLIRSMAFQHEFWSGLCSGADSLRSRSAGISGPGFTPCCGAAIKHVPHSIRGRPCIGMLFGST